MMKALSLLVSHLPVHNNMFVPLRASESSLSGIGSIIEHLSSIKNYKPVNWQIGGVPNSVKLYYPSGPWVGMLSLL